MVKIIKNNVWLILILLLASMFRVYRLDYLELFGDELDAGYQSYSLLQTGRDYRGNFLPFYMHSFSEWRAPGMMYAMVPFIKVFGLNEWGVRLPEAFFGVLSIFVFYWLLVELKIKKQVALGSVLFLAISPWHIQYSRSGFELVLMSTLLLAGTFYWIKSTHSNSLLFIFLSGFFYSVAIYTYNTANLYVPLLVFFTSYFFGFDRKKIVKLFFVGFFLCLPIIINVFWGSAADRFKLFAVWGSKSVTEEVISMRNSSGNHFSAIFYNKLVSASRKIVFNYSNAFGGDFLFGNGDVTFRHSLHYIGNNYWIFLPLIVYGIVLTLSRSLLNSSLKFMFLFLLLSPIPSSFTIDGYNHASRLFLMVFPISFWASLGFCNIGNKWLKMLVISVLLFEIANYQFYYWNNYKNDSWRWWHSGYKEAMSSIRTVGSDYDNILIDNVFEPSLIRYVFWNKVDPEYVFSTVDKMSPDVIDGYEGFRLSNTNVYFVNFNGPIKPDSLKKNNLYLFSQDINVVGDRDLNNSLPEGIEVLKTIRIRNRPIFYLVRGR